MPYAREAHPNESLRLEAVCISTNYDELLDETLRDNVPQVDTLIVVTKHDDHKTQAVCKKHCTPCVVTDAFGKDNGKFNKGAALNVGFDHFRFYGWRMVLDTDIILPRKFRHVLFNYTVLDEACIYGADRVNIYTKEELALARGGNGTPPIELDSSIEWKHRSYLLVESPLDRSIGFRVVDPLQGWAPSGYFHLWHASQQKRYPTSLGTAAHDDASFANLWIASCRRLMPEVIVGHLCTKGEDGDNWNGRVNYSGRGYSRQQPASAFDKMRADAEKGNQT